MTESLLGAMSATLLLVVWCCLMTESLLGAMSATLLLVVVMFIIIIIFVVRRHCRHHDNLASSSTQTSSSSSSSSSGRDERSAATDDNYDSDVLRDPSQRHRRVWRSDRTVTDRYTTLLWSRSFDFVLHWRAVITGGLWCQVPLYPPFEKLLSEKLTRVKIVPSHGGSGPI